MARDFTKLERSLRSQGTLPVKIELYADQEKQADTLGKRMARQTIARRIEQALTDRTVRAAEVARRNAMQHFLAFDMRKQGMRPVLLLDQSRFIDGAIAQQMKKIFDYFGLDPRRDKTFLV